VGRRLRKRVAKRRVGKRPTRSVRQDSAGWSPLRRGVLHNLPTQLTTFIGREREIAEVKGLLASSRLLTLTGSGGCGKTRLALRVAADSVDRYPDGVWFVDLAPLADPAFVPNSVAAVLDVAEQPTRPLTDTLANYLRTKMLVLVLDNCEHLHAACQRLADQLLRASATVRILATSREALAVEGELTYRVPPLRLPDVHQPLPVVHLREYDAIRLFAERAALGQPGFTVTAHNAPAILHMCQRLDGMPLAIEFAAARVAALSVEQIAARLDDRFRLLTARPKKTVPRHQTLRATLDWSHDLLSRDEQQLFRRLSLFVGGFTLEAAEKICAGSGVEERDILDLLTRLVGKSLITFDEQDGRARYRLLESVRQYGGDRLRESGEVSDAQRRHRDWYLGLAERAAIEMYGPEDTNWLNRLEVEHDNLRAALGWTTAEKDDAEIGLRLAAALWRLWDFHTHWSEGRKWLETSLARSADVKSTARVRALFGAARLASLQRGYGRAMVLFEESLALAQVLGDQTGIAMALMGRGSVAMSQGKFDAAMALFEESLSLSRELNNTFLTAINLGVMGWTAQDQEDYVQAVAWSEESLALFRTLGSKRWITYGLRVAGHAARLRGNFERATALYRESLGLFGETGDKWIATECIEGLAFIASARGDAQRAARLLGAAEAARETFGITTPREEAGDQEHFWVAVRDRPGRTAYAAAWAEGQALTLEQAIKEALATNAQSAWAEILTSRERQVVTLIARGRTNREIASELQVTKRTAETHVLNILNKLKVNSRTEIALWAITHGLHTPVLKSQ